MTEFYNRDFYNEFVEHYNNQKKALSIEIHNYLYELYRLNNVLDEHYNLLVKYNIPIGRIVRNEIKGTKIKVIEGDVDEDFIVTYNTILVIIDTIEKLKVILFKYNFYSKISYNQHTTLMYAINYEVTLHLLRGNPFTYHRLGELSIIRVPYDSSIPDWGRSFQFRDFLKSQGIDPKTKETPDGKNWFVDNGLGRDDFALVRWKRSSSSLKNRNPYRFYPMTRGNIYGKLLEKPFTIEELHENVHTGIFDKVIHIYKYHYDYCVMNYPFVDYVKKEKKEFNSNEINL